MKKQTDGTWYPNQQVYGGHVRLIQMIWGNSSGCYQFSFEEKIKILGCAMNRQGKTNDAIEERMQSANKAFWKDILVYKNKHVPWKVKCQRLVDHVYAVFAFGSENWSWTIQTENITGRETKTMIRLFRFKRRYKNVQHGQKDMDDKLKNVCCEPWDGILMKKPMQ